ncbi:uncharacterized protein [Apostichopus japonicus]
MRFVKTAPGKDLHNLHPVQHKKKIYYKVIKTIAIGTELLCWYEGATEPSDENISEESDLLPMPILEKMDFSENAAYKAPKRVPPPLEVHPDNLPEGLEPPLISPAYPVCHEGDALTGDRDFTTRISKPAEPLLTETDSQPSDSVAEIQEPDVTSTGGDVVLEESLDKSSQKNETESVTSSQTQKTEEVLKANDYKKVRKKKHSGNKKGRTKHSLPPKGAIKGKKVRDDTEMITDLYLIGPESVMKLANGEDRYKCQKCDKLCKYPVGLKIHLRTYHHYINVLIRGIAKKPWARGIALKREKDRRQEENPLNDTKDGSWKSVDCSLVQSALEKLKDIHDDAEKAVLERVISEESLGGSRMPEESLSVFGESFRCDRSKVEGLQSCDGRLNEMPETAQTDSSVVAADATECGTERETVSVRLKDENATLGLKTESEINTPIEHFGHVGTNVCDDKKVELLLSTTLDDSRTEKVANTTPQKKNALQVKQQKSPGGIFPKKFLCDLCHQAFAYKVWRDRHLRMHSESSSGHGCDVCSLKFFSKKDLIIHLKSEHGINHKSSSAKKEKLPKKVGGKKEKGKDKFDNSLGPTSLLRTVGDKGKGSMKLEKLVQSLQKIQNKEQSDKDGIRALQKKKKRGRTCLTKGYLCRLCGSAFSNPSNRSRHMRVQHGLSARKRAVESRMKEKRQDIVMLEDDALNKKGEGKRPVEISDISEQRPIPSVVKRKHSSSSANAKSSASHPLKESPSSKKASPLKGFCPADYGFWNKVPKTKVKENKVIAHQRNRSKRKSLFPFDPMEYQEFPRTPDISCPWNKASEPAPFVPKQKDVPPIRLHLLQLEENKLAAGHHAYNVDTDAMDLRVKGTKLSKSSVQYFQPLDLTHPPPAEVPQDEGCDANPYIHNLLSDSKDPLENLPMQSATQWKRTKAVRPRVKITSKMSSKKSLKNTPFINPVQWHFTCNICNLNFVSIRELSQHVVAHAEDFPYKCEFCMHVFTSSDELWDHKESKHSVKKMYVCSLCKQEFAYFSNLEKHQRESHTGVECTFNENLCNDVRPQNFTDPTKAFNLRACPLQVTPRVSFLREEISKLSPLKLRNSAQAKDKLVILPKKATPEKGMLFNPQRNHPFEQRRKIGFLSMLSDPRNQKQLGSKVNNVCTKCLLEFKDTSAFHVHIMECANIKEDASNSANGNDERESSLVQKKISKEHRRIPKTVILNLKNATMLKRKGRKRARPGSIIYDPQKYARVKSTSAFDDIHACAGCGKKFYFINKLERHMKMCPNREKIVNANKTNVALALRKRPRLNTMQHKCTNCDKHFTYLGSLEKHLLMCTSYNAVPMTASPPTDTSSSSGNADYATNHESLPKPLSLVDVVTQADSGQSSTARQQRKRVAPYWRLAENSL